MKSRPPVLVLVLVSVLVPACRRSTPAPTDLTVFAAASLREVFTALGSVFESQHPGTRVQLQLAGSQELRAQIEHGARADVFASADEVQMALLTRAGLVARSAPFAGNELVVVTPADNPAHLGDFWDLPRAPRIALGVPEVPVGRYALLMLDRAAVVRGPGFRDAVLARVVSRELNVRQALAKAVLGEVDAAVVYRTDALSAGPKVHAILIPPEVNTATGYEIAVLARAPSPSLASAFVAAVLAEPAQARLRAAGFSRAPARARPLSSTDAVPAP